MNPPTLSRRRWVLPISRPIFQALNKLMRGESLHKFKPKMGCLLNRLLRLRQTIVALKIR